TKRVGVAGTTSQVVERALAGRGPSGEITVDHVRFDSVATGEAALRDEDVDVLLVDGRRLEWRGEPDPELQALVIGAVQVATVQQRAAAAGVDDVTTARLLSPVSVENVRIGAVSGRTADDDAAVALMTVALLAAIVIYGNLVLTGVVEEKSSRVVEVLLARVPARALLGGKVVGIGLLGLAQLAVTTAAALVALMGVDTDLPAVTGGVLA
ncbi:MAG TPA: ABC transporter permease, partial [Nocardioides sp.]|nr:ABC transporter permease [Nocardioides sp.]